MTRKKQTQSIAKSNPGSNEINLEYYRNWLSPQEFTLLEKEITEPLPPTIRLNPLKTSHEFSRFLESRYGWVLEQIPFCASGYRIVTGESPAVSNTLEHRLGLYYVQEAASMLPVELFSDPERKPGLSLDMAASPGGKTTHLVSRLADRGLVIANDSSQGRIQALRIVLQNWGAVNNAVTCLPGEKFGTQYPEVFDRVLLDAPCSMQGLRTAESHPVKNVSDRESRQLSSRQFALLRSAIQAVRPGGEVVYSTCTLLPGEDELVVDAILKEFRGKVSLLDGQHLLPTPAPGLEKLDGVQLAPDMQRTIRLWPHRYHTAGFYACLLRKEEETLPEIQFADGIVKKLRTPTYLSDREMVDFYERFQEQFGFDLEAYCNSNQITLVRHFERIHLYPEILASQFPHLHALSAGMLLGEENPDGFLPSFEWVSRFGPCCKHNVILLDDETAKNWMSGMNIPLENSGENDSNSRFRILVNEHGQALGCGKTIGKELKNLLPRRMVYSSN